MKSTVAALLLWPCVALADQTVETKDGRRILLRDDGIYHTLNDTAPKCKESGRYTPIDYHYRNSPHDASDLANNRQSVCAIVQFQLSPLDSSTAQFTYYDENQKPKRRYLDALFKLSDLRQGERFRVQDSCVKKSCVAILCGTAAAYNMLGLEIKIQDFQLVE